MSQSPETAPAETGVKLFVPPGHFYSPIVDPKEAEPHIAALEAAPVPKQVAGVRIDHAAMVKLWRELVPFMTNMPFPETKTDGIRYTFDNTAYGWGDASVLHAMLRRFPPRRVIEIGSGWSSACMIDTVERYLDDGVTLTFIEPYQDLLRSLVGETRIKLNFLETPVQKVPLAVFDELQAGDLLFIDSTHILRTGSDVCFELFEVLPRLAAGVIVHIHDMFWPFEYPRVWAIDDNRSWNELYAVRAFLTHTDAWEVLMFNDYFGKLEGPLIEATYPRFLRNPGGGLWLRRR